MRRRHVLGTVFTVEAVIAGLVLVAVLAVVTYALVRRRAQASEQAERPRLEAHYVGVLTAFARHGRLPGVAPGREPALSAQGGDARAR
ncbi:hypothetical protein [Streptomyces sp. NPDC007905]|uniref:hypothetical protein n=1 Tax=Streptomyces sp. NPDC007905 TaxID=3364788 RepID=UPI0036F0BBE3